MPDSPATPSHTPGPWTVIRLPTGRYAVRADRAPDRDPRTYHSIVPAVGGDKAHHEGNARLIAGAPALLAALQAVATNLSLYGRPSDRELNDLRDIAHKAIAKATGGA